MCVYIHIHVYMYTHIYIHTWWCPRGITEFPRNASTAMDWWVSKDHTLNLKSLLSHSPSQLIKTWAILNQTKSTFLRLPVQNNIYLGCHKLNLEQSPHIPYGENRRLEWDWEELCNSFWRFGEKKGVGGIWKGCQPIRRKSFLELQSQIDWDWLTWIPEGEV